MNNNIITELEPQYTFNLPHPSGLGELDFKVTIRAFELYDNGMLLDTLEVDDISSCLYEVDSILFTDVTETVHDLSNVLHLQEYIGNNCWSIVVERVIEDYVRLTETLQEGVQDYE